MEGIKRILFYHDYVRFKRISYYWPIANIFVLTTTKET